MSGFFLLILAGMALLAALWRIGRLGTAALWAVGIGLVLGGTGYLWQGRPSLAGSPAPPAAARAMPDSAFAAERTKLLERFSSEAQILDAADAMHRSGYDAYAVGLIKGGLEKNPRSPDLWIGLGNALTLYAEGTVTPAAEFAFARAQSLAPDAPAPAYFRGLAYLQAGEPEETMRIWLELIEKAPADAPWRGEIALKLAKLREMMDAVAAGRMPTAPAPEASAER